MAHPLEKMARTLYCDPPLRRFMTPCNVALTIGVGD